MTKEKFQRHFVQGTLKWVKIEKPGTNFNQDPAYMLDLYVDETKKDEFHTLLKENKVKRKVRKDADGGEYFRFEKNVNFPDGTPTPKPFVIDIHKRPITDLIGNGSKGIVRFYFSPYDNKFGKGSRVVFEGLQVTNLVVFESRSASEDYSGFIAASDSDSEESAVNFDDKMPF